MIEKIKNNVTEIIKEKDDYLIKGKLHHVFKDVEDIKLVLMDEKEKKSFIRIVDYRLLDENTLEYKVLLNIDHIAFNLRKYNMDMSAHLFYLRITFKEDKQPFALAVTVETEDTQDLFDTFFEKPYGLTLRYLSFRCENNGILKLVTHTYNKKDASYLSERAPIYRYLGNKMSREKIILFGGHSPSEKTFNTWEFFIYLRRNHPEIKAYYILDKTEPSYQDAVQKEGEAILTFRSREYINKILQASLLVTDKNPEAFYPTGSLSLGKYIKADHWLLPAAPFGMTNEKYTLNKGGTKSVFSKIFMNSRSEIRFMRDSFGLNPDKMELTGMPASSHLVNNRENYYEESHLFLLPYIEYPYSASNNAGIDSFISLVRKENFQAFLKEYKLAVVIALPEQLKKEQETLETLGCRVIPDTEEVIIKNLENTRILITDNHPHALTYAVLNRALFFYHKEKRPNLGEDLYFESYQNELPGDIATNEEDLFYLLNQYAKEDFKMKDSFIKKTNLLFEYQDESVYNQIFESFKKKLDLKRS